MKSKKIDLLLVAGFTSNLFYSISYPIIHTICIKDLSSNLLSFSALLSSIFTIIITQIWLNHSEKLYKSFSVSLFIEGLSFGILLIAFLLGKITPSIYYLTDCILTSIITRNIISGGNRLKAIRYRDEDREVFDNKSTLYCNVASITGFGFSSFITLNTNIAFIFMWLGIVIDNFFYYIVYKKENKRY
ncbi:hypothetical protein [Intestinibacter sp.]|uniref:hypothetical protein n=1 Tax=Intestinibacter sp. TaxID=1965304 RepID=UPI002A74A5FF|nr:hypothetical protein [Intestinibacter sp.]MDY2737112.1 hypothetical protein [Intestinibacter sp.]